jgi:hypothetical protein
MRSAPLLALVLSLSACSAPTAPGDASTTDVGTDAFTPDAWVDPCEGVTSARVETVAMLSHGRYAPAVERLDDGRVLIAGGYDFTTHMTASAEIFDPSTRALSPTGDMNLGRNFAATTPVPGGVLVVGGFDDVNGSVVTIERFDLASGTFGLSNVGLAMGREAHTATLLPDGTVLLAGGLQARGLRFLSSIERYDPAADTIATSAGTLSPPRGFHAAAWIESRRSVLLVGGDSGMGELASAVRWQRDTDDVVPVATGRMRAGKAVAAATLANGHVLVAGGANATDGTLADTDEYDPSTDAFTPAAPMHTRRMAHTVTALGDRRLIAIGGWSDSEPGPAATASIEVRAADGTWTRLSVDLAVARLDHRAVAIDRCHVLVVGGQHAATGASPTAPREVELITVPASL